MIGWIIAALLVLPTFIPVGVEALFREDVFSLRLHVGAFSAQILPQKSKKNAKKSTKTKQKTEQKKPSLLSGGMEGLLRLVRFLLELLGDLRRKLRAENVQVYITTGGADAAKCAVNYGNAWMYIGALTPLLDRLLVIKQRDIHPILDYNETKMKFNARIMLTITVGRALALALKAGAGYLKIRSEKNKGGAEV
ncbi:MAG: hypothetical protein IIY04_02035 [Oscillospiraceae bacterium]|nr:hypothetical protein [Oscillospiraceae bacterium]